MLPNIFSPYDTQDLNRLAAKGILEKLRSIRQGINVEFTARRIIWELIQNAKDNVAVCNSNEAKVDIKIQLSKEKLSFIHNNGFFTNENIRGLIRRYSSSEKNRDYISFDTPPVTTGRFGTGFMTTHLLSEKVIVKGIFFDNDKNYKQFVLPIDRTGINEKEIINSIENSFRSVEDSVIKSQIFPNDLTNFKTEFIYELDEKGYKLAYIALAELDFCVGPTLINLPSIEKIELITDNEITIYKLIYGNKFEKSKLNFQIAELQKIKEIIQTKHFIVINNGKTKLILPIDYVNGKYKFSTFEDRVPRLFLDFPLVGTEELNLPFAISCPYFEPTEGRDGVSLTGSEDRDTKINSEILQNAVELYNLFLDEVSNSNEWCNYFNLARLKEPCKKEWINLEWYKKMILSPIRRNLLKVPIVQIDTEKRISIKNSNNKDQVYFPYSNKKEIREIIWKLGKELFSLNIPLKGNIDDWYEIIWEDCFKLTISELAKSIEEISNLNNLKSRLNKAEEETLKWLNEYYDLLYFEGKFIDEIIKGNYAIFPNQNGVFKKITELYIDEDIEEELKNILLLLRDDIRDVLLHKNIIVENKHHIEQKTKIPITKKDQEFVVQRINKLLENNPSAYTAVNHLLSLFSEGPDFPVERSLIYDFNRKIYGGEIPEKKLIKNWSKSIWNSIDAERITKLVCDISNTKDISGLQTLIKEDSTENTLAWLISFVEFLNKYGYGEKLNLKDHPILPNQNNDFRIKDDLFLDDGIINDELKDISKGLGYDIRSELLHKDIYLSLPESRIRNNEFIAEEITKLIKPIIKDAEQRANYEDLFKRLYKWMTQNKELAQNIFGEIFEKRFLLMSDDVIVSNLNKAEMLDDLLATTGLTIEEIKKKIGFYNNTEQTNTNNKESELNFDYEFISPDISLIKKVREKNSIYFPPRENLSFQEKLLQLISKSESPWAGFVYHFTHLENALKIIEDRKILPRNKATFKDSAGSSFINTTLDEIKNFARFYFRPLTPTQYYNEGLGRITKYGDLPQCPVMIFFKFNLKEVLEKKGNQCYVSNGNLRHYPITKFGNDYEFLKSFDFKNLFCKYGECDNHSFINASQQEFIVKDEFDFSDIENFQIICRTQFEKDALVNLIGENHSIIDKISVEPSYYYNSNSFVEVERKEHILNVKIPYGRGEDFIKIISNKKINSYKISDTIKFQKSVELKTSYEGEYKIYYLNEETRQEWLIYASRSSNN